MPGVFAVAEIAEEGYPDCQYEVIYAVVLLPIDASTNPQIPHGIRKYRP